MFGIEQSIIVSRKRSPKLRIARSVLVAIAQEMGYTMIELTGSLNRDISVLSKLSNNAGEAKCQALIEHTKELIAHMKA